MLTGTLVRHLKYYSKTFIEPFKKIQTIHIGYLSIFVQVGEEQTVD